MHLRPMGAGRSNFGYYAPSELVFGLNRSKKFFGNFIAIFLIGIAAGQTGFKFQTFAKPAR
jgi:hypothetical protein